MTEVEPPGNAGPDGLRLRKPQTVRLRPGQALVHMEATGVRTAGWQTLHHRHRDRPFVFGYGVVGVVGVVGDVAEGEPVRVGQRVAALTGIGGWSDRIVLATADLFPVPEGISAEEAEAVLVNGVTARRMLAMAATAPGDVVVVLGAAGGVASLLVQMARRAGAQVIAEAPTRHLPYVRELGAVPVDHDSDLAAAVRAIAPGGADTVFGHHSGSANRQPRALLRNGGIHVTSAHDPGHPSDPHRFHAELRDDLDAVFGQVQRGELTAHIARAFPLSQAMDAVRYAESGVAAGQIVLVADEA